MENIKGLEKVLDEFLKELLIHPIIFIGEKYGYVNEDYYYKKFKINQKELNELIYYVFKNGFIHKLIQEQNKISEISVNLRGKVFLNNGGYVWEKRKATIQ